MLMVLISMTTNQHIISEEILLQFGNKDSLSSRKEVCVKRWCHMGQI